MMASRQNDRPETTESRLRRIIDEEALIEDPQTLGLNERFCDAGMDSLDHTELILSVEDEFDVAIDPGDEDGLDTLQKLVDFIDKGKA